jgi:ABC-2 type transport system ATP-binding protein
LQLQQLCKPEILIVDEILSVGDFKFQEKSENKIKEMLLHLEQLLFLYRMHIAQIEEICTKVLWLEHGRVRGYGNTKEICEEYKNS